jgi:VCBS repeat-containing protein
VDGSASQVVTVTITGVNDVPVIAGVLARNLTEDASTPDLVAGGALTIADTDAGENAFVAQSGTAGEYGTFTVDAAGNWSYTALNEQAAIQALAAGDRLVERFTVTSADGSASQVVTVRIIGANDVPVIGGVTTGEVTEDASTPELVTDGALTIVDADAGESAFVAQSGTAGSNGYGIFTLDASGNWSYTALNSQAAIQALAAGETLSDSFTATSVDGSASQLVTVTITGVNDVPVVLAYQDGALTEDASTPNLGTSGTISFGDADLADTHTVRVTPQAINTLGGVMTVTLSDPASGTGAGTVTWNYNVDNSAAQYLAAGQTVVERFTVRILDDRGGVVAQRIEITVTGTNDAPVIVSADSFGELVEDQSTPDLVLTGSIVFADADLADTHAITVTADPGNSLGGVLIGTLDPATGSGTGVVNGSYVVLNSAVQHLAAGEVAIERFTVTISDGNGGTVEQLVMISVIGVNDVPVARDDIASTTTNTAVTIDVLANDADIDAGTLVVTAFTQGTRGAVSTGAGGTLVYTPLPGFFGTDSFTYELSDGQGGLDTATVQLVVQEVGAAPVLEDDVAQTPWGVPVRIDVLANDSDPDQDVLQLAGFTQGANGSVSQNDDGTLSYAPAQGFAGQDSFSYSVDDGFGHLQTATVVVEVLRTALVWTNTSGDSDWENPENWNQGVIPTAADSVLIPDGAGAPVVSGPVTLTSLVLFDELIINDGSLLLGGESRIEGSGHLILNDATLSGTAALLSNGRISASNAIIDIPFTNNGELLANGLEINQGAGDFTNTGLIVIPDAQRLSVVANSFLNLGEIQGRGILDVSVATFINSGLMSPGSSPGILALDGNFVQSATGVLLIEIGGTIAGEQYDQLAVSGTATLDGELRLVLINGYIPRAGDSIEVLTAARFVGNFSQITGLPNGVSYDPVNGTLSVYLFPPIFADGTQSGLSEEGGAFGSTTGSGTAGSAPIADLRLLSSLEGTLFPASDDFMVGDLDWQAATDDLLRIILGEDTIIIEGAAGTPLIESGLPPETSNLDTQLREIVESFTREQQEILEVLRKAEELVICR